MANGLTVKQTAFIAAYIGECHGNGVQSARKAGYAGNDATLRAIASENLTKPNVAATVAEYLERIEAEGLAVRANRVAVYQDVADRILRVIAERAADSTMQDVPGGPTGMVVRDYRGKDADRAVYQVDAGTSAELRATLKQLAQDMGQWTEKQEVHGDLTFAQILSQATSTDDTPEGE